MDEEEICFRCDRSKEEVRLLDAVYGNEVVKICEECALIEDVPIIRKPTSSQLIESEKPFSVRQRLRRMAGLSDEKAEAEKISKITRDLIQNINLDNLRKPKDYRQVLDEKFSLARKRNVPVNLVDNFNWLIMMERKKRKIDRKQLADSIGEPEIAIKMIENKEMPDDASRILNKIEQYFGIKLRKKEALEEEERIKEVIKSRLSRPERQEIREQKQEQRTEPAVVLKFDKEIAKNITIADLQRMKQERERKDMKRVENVVWDKDNKPKEKNEELTGEIEFEE